MYLRVKKNFFFVSFFVTLSWSQIEKPTLIPLCYENQVYQVARYSGM